MSKKQDAFYFQNFMECADHSRQAVKLLKEIMIHFDLESLPVYLDKKHDLLNTLAKAFITPIEQEDIMQISQNLDDLTDKIEDVLIRIYYNHITEIRSDALGLVDMLIRCCEEV